jgi:hypothetical protein
MKFRIPIFHVALALSVFACAAPAQQPAPAHRTPPRKITPQVQPVQPAPVLVQPAAAPAQSAPPTPEEGPSSPPQVTFKGGQLTIEARNSTMADVLNAVKQRTGASVDMPAVSNERVVGRFGPGAPRDVMAQLLNGSHYDYVLLGSPADPGALKKIVLMARAAGPEPAPSQQANAQQGFRQNLQAVPEVDTDQGTTDDSSADASPEVQQPPPDESQQPETGQQDQNQGQNGPAVKTPEQLLRELQQQQQQQQPNSPPQ